MADTEVRYIERPAANLNGILDAISTLGGQVSSIDSEVNHVNGRVVSLRDKLQMLVDDFRQFVEEDLKARRLQAAETDIVSVRQELELRFSHHQSARRYVTGIMQATDASLVRAETISNCVESLMMDVPRYWLIPCLIAMAAWLADNPELAHRALREGMRRDDEKTSLLFALICRRIGRDEAAAIWLERFFSMQDPMAMQRKIIVLLDAYSAGLFVGDARGACGQNIERWMRELEEQAGYRETQVSRWQIAIDSKTPTDSITGYGYLSQHATNWTELERSYHDAMLHKTLYTYFQNILETKIRELPKLKSQLDEVLDSLVSNYDDEELPLRKRQQYLQFVIEEKGDVKKADAAMAAVESTFDETVDFSQLITNAAMHPEQINASVSTQKLSISLARDWAIEAYEALVARNRMRLPGRISVDINGWKGISEDGSNEKEMQQDARSYFERLRDDRLMGIKQSPMDFFWLIASFCVLLISLVSSMPIAMGIIALCLGIFAFLSGRKKMNAAKNDTLRQYESLIKETEQIIMACCAETVDYYAAIQSMEVSYEDTLAYMKEIVPHSFVKNTGERNIHFDAEVC